MLDKIVDTSDRPFGLPELITTVVDLPFPPSVNKIWRSQARENGSTVYLSKEYRDWKDKTDLHLIANRTYRQRRIAGRFEAHIGLNANIGRWGDLDNRIKAVMDYAQSRNFIADDKHCRRLIVEWVDDDRAQVGCRLTLRELVA